MRRLPAEWEKQQCVLMSFPHQNSDWVQNGLEASLSVFIRIAQEPKAMMVLMLLPPVEKEGKKIYEIEFIKGKITVNGSSF